MLSPGMNVAKKLFTMLALSLLLSTLPAGPAAAEADLSQLIKEVEPAVLFIRIYNQDKQPLGLGSGFFISPDGEFITNRHVLAKAYYAVAESPNGKTYPVIKVTGVHPEADLVKGMVGNITEPVPYLRISKEGVVKGQRVYAFGNPSGLVFTVSDGIVSGFRSSEKFGEVIQMTTPISGGSSGGPVVNANGEVVGISVGGVPAGQNLNFAVKASYIAALVPPTDSPLVPAPGGETKAAPPQAPPPSPPAAPKPQPPQKSPPSDNKQRFLFIAANPEYDSYLDQQTVAVFQNRETGAIHSEVWVKDNYKPHGKARMIEAKSREGQGEKYYNFNSTLTQIRLKHTTNKFTLLRVIYYDDAGAIIDTIDFRKLPPREDDIAPGTLIEKVANIVAEYIAKASRE